METFQQILYIERTYLVTGLLSVYPAPGALVAFKAKTSPWSSSGIKYPKTQYGFHSTMLAVCRLPLQIDSVSLCPHNQRQTNLGRYSTLITILQPACSQTQLVNLDNQSHTIRHDTIRKYNAMLPKDTIQSAQGDGLQK